MVVRTLLTASSFPVHCALQRDARKRQPESERQDRTLVSLGLGCIASSPLPLQRTDCRLGGFWISFWVSDRIGSDRIGPTALRGRLPFWCGAVQVDEIRRGRVKRAIIFIEGAYRQGEGTRRVARRNRKSLGNICEAPTSTIRAEQEERGSRPLLLLLLLLLLQNAVSGIRGPRVRHVGWLVRSTCP